MRTISEETARGCFAPCGGQKVWLSAAMAVLALLTGGLAAQPVPCTFYDHAANNAVPPGYVAPSFLWSSVAIDSTLNFNSADYVNAGTYLGNVPYSQEYTLVMVCKPRRTRETVLWNLDFGDSVVRGFSTERILLRNGGSLLTSIQYASQTDNEPIIATLRQSAPAAVQPNARLNVGDTVPMKVAEVQYYSERVDDNLLRRIQSDLAIRYGITLGPVDYVSRGGTVIWDHYNNQAFHHRITGVGADMVVGLNQLRSRSEMRGSLLTVSTTAMVDGTYLLIGDDDAPLYYNSEYEPNSMTWNYRLSRYWKVQNTGAAWQPFTLAFDKRLLPASYDSLVLILDGAVYRPSMENGDSVVFGNIVFSNSTHQFTLGYGKWLWQQAVNGNNGGAKRVGSVARSEKGDTGAKPAASVYPNPTRGHFTLAVSGAGKAGRVSATVYNTQGAVVATFSGSGRESYTFEGDLPSGNIYYATISTDNGSQTIKLVVK